IGCARRESVNPSRPGRIYRPELRFGDQVGQTPRWRLHRLMSQPSRCAAHVYSYRNASVGDTRAARRAGVYAASRASVTITAAPKTIGTTLSTGRPGIRLATKRLP